MLFRANHQERQQKFWKLVKKCMKKRDRLIKRDPHLKNHDKLGGK